MNNNYINFRRERDLGAIISDTFKFLRENYKLLFKMIFKLAGPVFIIVVLALGYYYHVGGETMGNPFLTTDFEINAGGFFLSLFILLASLLIFFVLLQGTVLHFVKSYVDNQGKVIESQVSAGVKNDFGKLLGVTIMVAVLTFIGLMLCVLPGVYLWVPLSLALPLLVFGRFSAVDSIGESFSLIKDNWWMTFFSLFVMVLLVYIIGLIFQIPLFIYYFIKMISMVQEGSAADPTSLFDWVYVVVSVISSLAQYLLSTIVVIATAFIYFNLDEKKNATGSFETISNLGSSPENR